MHAHTGTKALRIHARQFRRCLREIGLDLKLKLNPGLLLRD